MSAAILTSIRLCVSGFAMSTAVRGSLSGNPLFRSNGEDYGDGNCLAPVVSLGSGIQVKSGSGTESDPYVIGK